MAFTTRFAATAGLFLAFMFVPRPTAAAAHQPAAAQVPATPPVTLKVGSIDLAYIAAMHFNAPTQGARRGSRKRAASMPAEARVPRQQAAPEPARAAA